MSYRWLLVSWLLLVFLGTPSCGVAENQASVSQLESPTKIVGLAIYPPGVELSHADDFQQVVAVATQADGLTIDVTDLSSWRVEVDRGKKELLTRDDGRIVAAGDATGAIRAEFAGLMAEIGAQAKSISVEKPVSFRHDVMPILAVAGCNSGGCHGASRGKDGFRLSLFGFDPAGDYHRLTREMVGRRVNQAMPEESLLLLKSIGAVTHTGGKRFEKRSVPYQRLRDWIASGVESDLDDAPEVTAVNLYPPRAVLGINGQSQRFVAVAEYSDGSTRDVTELTVFQSNNTSSAEISPKGVVVSGRRGEAFVTARFDTHTVGSQVLVLPTDQAFKPIAEEPVNYIDHLVNDKLNTLRICPSEVCTDEEFLRRASIDIAGRLPTPEEVLAFIDDKSADKRRSAIDRLLAEPGFSRIWGSKWAELLLVRTEPNRVEYKPMFLYSGWLTEQIESGRPLDEMVHDLLSASGSTFDTPATNFYQIEPDSKKIAENVAQTFLGIRMQCAQCHNHPFDRWTMEDYYAFTAFFSQIARKRGEDYREWYLYDRRAGEAKHPVTGRQVPAKYLGGDQPEMKGRDRRAVLADWVVSPENPYFAPSIANRVWAHFFGTGIVEPVDDIRVSNPPSNPELFAELGRRFADDDYNLKHLVTDICMSRAYQRSCKTNETNEGDTRNFARAYPRRLPAEVLLDCVSQVTESPEKLPNLPLGSQATEIADGRAGNYFLKTFGRSQRTSVCACEAKAEPTLSQALHLLNGSTITKKINGGRVVERLLKSGRSPASVVDEIYRRCLSRLPSDSEREELLSAYDLRDDTETMAETLRDVFWAVLNSREFLFNH